MFKKGSSHDTTHIVLLAIVGMVALVGLILVIGGGSGRGVTSAVSFQQPVAECSYVCSASEDCPAMTASPVTCSQYSNLVSSGLWDCTLIEAGTC